MLSGLSLRRTSERLSCFVKRNHVSVWNWIQKYHPQKTSSKRKKVDGFAADEKIIKAGSGHVRLCVAIEPKNKAIPALTVSKQRNMFVAERFVACLVRTHGKHAVSTDGGTWHPQACRFPNLKHHIHSSLEKSLIERAMQYIKDRAEGFDDYLPCGKAGCSLHHVKNWLNLFAGMRKKRVTYA